MSVERFKELPPVDGMGEAPGRRLVVLLADAPHPDPLGEQLVSLAEAIEKAEKEELDHNASHRGGDFRRFRISLPKDPDPVPAAAGRSRAARGADGGGGGGGGRVRGEPHGRAEAFGVALSSMQIWYGTCSRPSSRARCRGLEASPDMRR